MKSYTTQELLDAANDEAISASVGEGEQEKADMLSFAANEIQRLTEALKKATNDCDERMRLLSR